MDFALSEEQRMLVQSVSGFLRSASSLEVVRTAAASEEPCDTALTQGLVELGIPGLLIEEDFGGVGLGMLEAALVAEALGATAAPCGFTASAVMAPLMLRLGGSDAQRGEWLPLLATGAATIGVGVTERIGRRDSRGISASGDRLSGSAMFVLDGLDATALIIADDTGRLYLVEPGEVQQTRLQSIDRTRSLSRVELSGAPAHLLPGSANSQEPLKTAIDAGRIALAADTLGAAQKMLDDAVSYAKERRQFNRVIGSFQAVKHMCAEMAAELEPCRSLVWYAAHAMSMAPDEARAMACHAKAHLGEVGRFVARTSTEVHGGMGMTDLLGLHYWFKRIGLNRQLLGSPELVREEAAAVQGWI